MMEAGPNSRMMYVGSAVSLPTDTFETGNRTMLSNLSRVAQPLRIIGSCVAGILLALNAAMAQLPPPDFRSVTIDQGSPTLVIGRQLANAIVSQDFVLPERLLLSGIRFWTIEGFGFDGTINWAIHQNAGGQPGPVIASGIVTSGYTKTATGRIFPSVNWPEYLYDVHIPPVTLPSGPLHLALKLNSNCIFSQQIFWSPASTGSGGGAWVQNTCSGSWQPLGGEHAFQLLTNQACPPPTLQLTGPADGQTGVPNDQAMLTWVGETTAPTPPPGSVLWGSVPRTDAENPITDLFVERARSFGRFTVPYSAVIWGADLDLRAIGFFAPQVTLSTDVNDLPNQSVFYYLDTQPPIATSFNDVGTSSASARYRFNASVFSPAQKLWLGLYMGQTCADQTVLPARFWAANVFVGSSDLGATTASDCAPPYVRNDLRSPSFRVYGASCALNWDVFFAPEGQPFAQVASAQRSPEFNPGPLECDRVYQWQVRARNDYGESVLGPVRTFRTAPDPCPGDSDRNGSVSFADITNVLANLGSSGPPRFPGDCNCDGAITFADITTVLAALGTTCN